MIKTAVSSIAVSLLTIIAMMTAIGYVALRDVPDEAPLDAAWASVESDVRSDILSSGYKFLAHAHEWEFSIPAIDVDQFKSCLSQYAELEYVKHDRNFGPNAVNRTDISHEYMFKYNQIVKIELLKSGVSCESPGSDSAQAATKPGR